MLLAVILQQFKNEKTIENEYEKGNYYGGIAIGNGTCRICIK